MNRRSIRSYSDKHIDAESKNAILEAALRAPTAGNMMLYSIIDIQDPSIKATLSKTCDNQPFIAKAPLLLLFLADYQHWYDYFIQSDVETLCRQRQRDIRKPKEGDLLLACCDALIAAQTAAIAAESLGIGSCYIGDILENYETHRDLLKLPSYVLPIGMLCMGYPQETENRRSMSNRFSREYIVSRDRYTQWEGNDLKKMYEQRQNELKAAIERHNDIKNLGQFMYFRKFDVDFGIEMNRSVQVMLSNWR